VSFTVTNLVKISQMAARVIEVFLFSKWRPAIILDFVTGQKWRYGRLRTVHVYHRAKFCDGTSTGGRVIAFSRMLAILDHPRSLLMDLKRHSKFGVNRTSTFQDIVILKF